jgi:ribosomal protein L22
MQSSKLSKYKQANHQMKSSEKLSLIEGKFSAEEAKEVLMNVYLTKINFHKRKNFSSKERFGIHDHTAEKRIPELKKCLDKMLEFVADAQNQNKTLIVTSEINISISED